MTRIGSSDKFAVDVEIAADHGGVWLFGHFCYWCDGQMVGNRAVSTSLRDVLFQLERVVGDRNCRRNPRFDVMSARDAADLLSEGLFGDDESTLTLAIKEQWRCHLIAPEVDIMDQWKVFLFEEKDLDRVVWQRLDDGAAWDLRLRKGEVDEVLEEVVGCLRENHALVEADPSKES